MANFLNQEEIDALLHQANDSEEALLSKEALSEGSLSTEEMDALGEIANISMGSGATALSELVREKVVITNPHIVQVKLAKFINQLPRPHLAIMVDFTSGLKGSNLLVISNRDAGILTRMMMGESASSDTEYLDEMQISAASEAMNQMVASAATAMSQVFQVSVNISPPELKLFGKDAVESPLWESFMVIIKFQMSIGESLNSEIFQMMPMETAKDQVRLLFHRTNITPPEKKVEADHEKPLNEVHPVVPQPPGKKAPTDHEKNREFSSFSGDAGEEANMDLILDIPLTVSVVLGRTKKPIQEILLYQSGSIVELNRLVDENVDVMVNDVLVARGEVVVINDNFGVRITNIINPGERINQLRNGTLF